MRVDTLHANTRPVTCVTFNRDGDLLFCVGKDGGISAWHTSNSSRIGTYHVLDNDDPFGPPSQGDLLSDQRVGTVSAVDVKYDSSKIICGSFTDVVIFDVLTGRLLDLIKEDGGIQWVEWSKNFDAQNKFLVVHNKKGGDSTTSAIKIYEGTEEPNISVPLRRADGTIIMEGDVDNPGNVVVDAQTHRCMTSTTKVIYKTILRIQISEDARCAKWGPLDKTIVSGHDDGCLCLWDAVTGEQKTFANAHKSQITNLAVNEERSLLASVSKDGWCRLWNLSTLEMISQFDAGRPLNCVSLSPFMTVDPSVPVEKRRMHVIVGGGQESEAVTTSAESGEFFAQIVSMMFANEVCAVLSHFSPINTVAWSPDGSKFVTGAEEGQVKIHHMPENFYVDLAYE